MLNVSHIISTVVTVTALSIVLSAVGTVIAFRQRGGGSFRDFLKYVFPRDLITRWSCYQDVGFILVKKLLQPLVYAPILLLTSAKGAILTYGLMTDIFGPRAERPMSVVLYVILLAAAVLVQDFFRFYSHCLLHRIDVLWDFHKVHHSAEYLTPLTNHRAHVIEEAIQQTVTGLSVGPLLGLTAFLTQTAISTNALLGFDAYMLIDALCFSMLRHSHIGLSFYGLERFLLSPKQHHLHHSIDQRHWDKNFGFMFAFWDRMAGTICYSNPHEDLAFGISEAEGKDYGSVLKLHFMPYIKLVRRFWPRPEPGREIPKAPPTALQAETPSEI
jgi:sterol desaturase/sphingolipid hydroxylase (fatty acid hydroxylase superfamily)